jgi:hypothetical protein
MPVPPTIAVEAGIVPSCWSGPVVCQLSKVTRKIESSRLPQKTSHAAAADAGVMSKQYKAERHFDLQGSNLILWRFVGEIA